MSEVAWKFRKGISFLNRNTVGIIDIDKLYMLAKKKHLEIEFEKFMVVDGREDLKHWVERNRISLDEIKCCMKYKINVGDIQMEKGRMQIMNFMRDPYGNPYIPGSSIKGNASYNFYIAADIMKNPLYYKQDVQKIKMELDGRLEIEIFYKKI